MVLKAGFALPPRRQPPTGPPPEVVGPSELDSADDENALTFPLPAAVIADPARKWTVGGRATPLADDDAFAAAFEALDAAACPPAWRPVTRATLGALAAWKQRRLVEALAAPPPHARDAFPHDAAFEPVDVLTPGAVRISSQRFSPVTRARACAPRRL